MNCKVYLPPPEQWQTSPLCSVSIAETQIASENKCDYCKSTPSFVVQPEIKTEIVSNQSWIKEDLIIGSIQRSLVKIFKDRHVCNKEEC